MPKLISYLPKYYKTSGVMNNIQNSNDAEIAAFRARMASVENQFFIDTADFSIDRWEKEFGIPVNAAKPLDQRKSVVKSKKRGVGTVKISLIKKVAESFDGGTVNVTENNAAASFAVKFVDNHGIPPNLDDLKRAIEDIKPAHLAVVYEFTYLLFDTMDSNAWTFNDLDALNLTFDELEVL